MMESNRVGDSIGERLLEEISVTVGLTQKYVRMAALTLLSPLIFLATFVPLIILVEWFRSKMWIFLGPFLAIFIAETICALLFLFRAGLKSHDLVQSCKKHLKSVSTIREMELINLVSDLRNLFFICVVAFCFSAHVIWLITISMINEIKMGYLGQDSVSKVEK